MHLCQKFRDLTAGKLIVAFVEKLEEAGVSVAYLRNHQDLPQNVGNDADILIPLGKSEAALAILTSFTKDTPWVILNSVRFGPLSIFLVNSLADEFLHIDLFERLDWHFVPIADTQRILQRRVWNGTVRHAHPEDEIVLNLITRLIYHGEIREKHRQQVQEYLAGPALDPLQETLVFHLGATRGREFHQALLQSNWEQLGRMKVPLRINAIKRAIFKGGTASLVSGIIDYVGRSLRRALSPPGPFIVFEGADGVGKSSLITALIPTFYGITGRKDTLLFHWKPTRNSTRLAHQDPGQAQDPRGRPVRSVPLSLLFLVYHWFGFWAGYFRFVYPARIKNRVVVGDRYAYEFFLDPHRLRLRAPQWLLHLASSTVPQPQLVIALFAAASVVTARKPELSPQEIESYQRNLGEMAKRNPSVVLIDTEGDIGIVTKNIGSTIVSRLQTGK